MHTAKSTFALLALLLGGASPALAGTVGAFEFSNVTAISPQVTYSKPAESLTTYVAFQVGSGGFLLKNTSGNTLNDITITFTARVTDGAETLQLFDPATYLAGLPAGCTKPTAASNPVEITCQLRQYKAGDSFPAFTVFYKAPAKVTQAPPQTPVGDDEGTDLVTFDIKVVYAEGTNGGNPRPNSVADGPSASAVLGTENPELVKSAVPKGGTTLFTGVGAATTGAVATTSDPWTTTVVIPANFSAPTGNYTIATIAETITTVGTVDCTRAANLLNCSDTTLTIPGGFANLVIFLRRDASTLAFPNRPGDIDSAKVFYSNPQTPNPLATYPLEVPACSVTTYGPLPQIGLPCIKERKRYTNSNSPSSEWLRDWEFQIWALDNGRYAN